MYRQSYRHALLVGVVVVGAGLVLFSDMNLAGTSTTSSATAPTPAAPTSEYTIRCWQYGKLIFEERQLAPMVEPFPYVAKLKRNDRQGSAMFLTDTRNATCLIRSATKVASER